MQNLGHTYSKKLFAIYLKFKFRWYSVFYLVTPALPGRPALLELACGHADWVLA